METNLESDLPERVRAFVALPLPPALVEELSQLRDKLRKAAPERLVRWCQLEQMHLTLKFLGNVFSRELPNLIEALLQAIGNAKAFQLHAEKLGCFPNARTPRVIWVGVAGDLPDLQALQSTVQQQTVPWTQREEKRSFEPHLTLGRIQDFRSQAARAFGQVINTPELAAFVSRADWRAKKLELMRSKLSSAGARYSMLASFALKE